MDFFNKILKVASITMVLKKGMKGTTRKGNLLLWMRLHAINTKVEG